MKLIFLENCRIVKKTQLYFWIRVGSSTRLVYFSESGLSLNNTTVQDVEYNILFCKFSKVEIFLQDIYCIPLSRVVIIVSKGLVLTGMNSM